MAKRSKRKGETVTFSVSVDKETKKLLRSVADRAYHGNVSELITQMAEQAARQEAARELLELHGRKPMTDEECAAFEAEIQAELTAQSRPKRRKGHAA